MRRQPVESALQAPSRPYRQVVLLEDVAGSGEQPTPGGLWT